MVCQLHSLNERSSPFPRQGCCGDKPAWRSPSPVFSWESASRPPPSGSFCPWLEDTLSPSPLALRAPGLRMRQRPAFPDSHFSSECFPLLIWLLRLRFFFFFLNHLVVHSFTFNQCVWKTYCALYGVLGPVSALEEREARGEPLMLCRGSCWVGGEQRRV